MDAATRQQLQLVHAATAFMAALDGQDAVLVVEMAQAMLSDLLDTGALADLTGYVRRYCDVIGQADEAGQIGAGIRDLAGRGGDR